MAWVDSIEFISVTMNCSINVPMKQSPCVIKSLCYLLPFVPRVCCVLTASGCARPRCHVIAICTQDWLTSGRVAMISSMVTSLSSGGGCLMVQGVLGTQAHQSNWKHDNGWVCQWLSVVPQGASVCLQHLSIVCSGVLDCTGEDGYRQESAEFLFGAEILG